MRPSTRVVRRPLEGLDAVEVGDVGRRQAAGGHHHKARPELATVCVQAPLAAGIVPVDLRDRRLEADVAAQVVAVGDVVGVAEDLGLAGVAL